MIAPPYTWNARKLLSQGRAVCSVHVARQAECSSQEAREALQFLVSVGEARKTANKRFVQRRNR